MNILSSLNNFRSSVYGNNRLDLGSKTINVLLSWFMIYSKGSPAKSQSRKQTPTGLRGVPSRLRSPIYYDDNGEL